jgi:hypothetical protein
MATTQTRPYLAGNDSIKLEYGVPQIACFKWLEGKSVPSQFGERAMFTAIDSRKLFVDGEDASDIERGMRDLGIRPGEDFVRLTKIRHSRGGGHSIRVERVDEGRDPDNAPAWVRDVATAPASRPPAPPSREEALLEQSVALALQHGARAFQRPPARISPEPPPATAPTNADRDHSASDARPDDTARRLMSCFAASIEAITEAQAFADRKGLKVTFTSEDVRATAISAFIQTEKAMMTVRY